MADGIEVDDDIEMEQTEEQSRFGTYFFHRIFRVSMGLCCYFQVDSMKSRVTKKKGRGLGGETHGDVKEYEALEQEGAAGAPQRFFFTKFFFCCCPLKRSHWI